MKTAVLYAPGDIRVENVSQPAVEPGGILIHVKACGICGSDLHLYKMGWPAEAGLVMGHEFSGDVVKVGASVADIRKGERVTAASLLPCGDCQWCRRGQLERCSSAKILGLQCPGAFAEYVSIPIAVLNKTVFPLPDGMSYEDGAMVEPLSVGGHAAIQAEPSSEDTVVILGAGMIGQCSLQAFKAMGVSRVIVSEISRKRLEVAREMGADVVINAAEEDPVRRVREETSGMGADIVAECAGMPSTFQQALAMVRGSTFETASTGGKILLVGIYEQPIQWAPLSFTRKNVRMIGCFAGSFPKAIDLIQTGKVNTRPLITHEFPLGEAREAFETQLKADESIKVLIKP